MADPSAKTNIPNPAANSSDILTRRRLTNTVVSNSLHVALMLVVLVWLSMLRLSEAATPGQQNVPTQKTAMKCRSFDVASVRPSSPDAPRRGLEMLAPFGAETSNGRISANAPVLAYINFAYDLVDHSQYQQIQAHLPPWAQTTNYAIEAKAEGQPSKAEMREMMRSLLIDRFGFFAHQETVPRPVYDLVLNKQGMFGPHLTAHPPSVTCTPAPVVQNKIASNEHTSYCGLNMWMQEGQMHLHFEDVAMKDFIAYVGGAATSVGGLDGRPVVDKTGVNSKVDIDLEFAAISDPGKPLSENIDGPTFSEALSKQLGLKLIRTDEPVLTFIVDQIHQPSAN